LQTSKTLQGTFIALLEVDCHHVPSYFDPVQVWGVILQGMRLFLITLPM